MDKVRLDIIGLGNMDATQASQAAAGKIPLGELLLVCDQDEARRMNFEPQPRFTDPEAKFGGRTADAVLIAASASVKPPPAQRHGNLDRQTIVAAADESGCRRFIVEQDPGPGDPFESVAKSYRYVSAHLCS